MGTLRKLEALAQKMAASRIVPLPGTPAEQMRLLARSADFWEQSGTQVPGVGEQRTALLLSLACDSQALLRGIRYGIGHQLSPGDQVLMMQRVGALTRKLQQLGHARGDAQVRRLLAPGVRPGRISAAALRAIMDVIALTHIELEGGSSGGTGATTMAAGPGMGGPGMGGPGMGGPGMGGPGMGGPGMGGPGMGGQGMGGPGGAFTPGKYGVVIRGGRFEAPSAAQAGLLGKGVQPASAGQASALNQAAGTR